MPLNRIITIQHPVTVRGRFGGETTTWEPYATVWASKEPIVADEVFNEESNIRVASRVTTWRTNFDPGISELMRIVDDENLIWNIIGLATVGPRDRWNDIISESNGERLP